ncbi:hypothetical protein SDC9_80080 [bioreactor metagenome]|uniref:HMA domain-containing protein n=1 Tax=bioreactor metagenome TaxID=1076179 RepID=A0A644Z5Y2_9ZZZZ
MKHIFKISVLAFFILFTFGAKAQDTTAPTGAGTQQTDVAVYNVKVMFHCANGKALLESELPKKRGVVSAVAHLDTKIVDVTYDTKLTKPETINEYIHQIGYLVESDPADTKLNNKACSHGEGHQE